MDNTDSYNVTAEADQAHDDQWLADQIVALGILIKCDNHYRFPGSAKRVLIARAVRDWRVAGALMEKCHCLIVQNERGIWLAKAWVTDESPRCEIADSASSLARAINEACIAALL